MLNSIFKKAILSSIVLLCIVGCLTDLALIYIFGKQIPGYNQFTGTISSLGVSTSPVSWEVTVWSVILGVIFVLFGIGFRIGFPEFGKETRKASLLIITYGLGDNVASGIFKADHLNGALTIMAVVHNLLGGIGIIALILLPLVMMKIFTRESFPAFFRFSGTVWVIGLISILFFSFRIVYFENSFLNTYKGLWQRIFLVDYYIYFTAIAYMMMKKIHEKATTTL
jgi:hypothetical protein